MRALAVICVVLALAGAKVETRSDELSVVFLMDRSLSTGGDSQGFQRRFIEQALVKKRPEDRFGVVLFGEDAGIELPTAAHGGAEEVSQFTTVVSRGASSLTSALRFAATSFPGETARRLVVITDGQSTESGAEAEIRALSEAGIEVWLVPLPDQSVADVLLSRFESPSQAAQNEPFLLKAVVESRGIESCRLLITENGTPKQNLTLKLRPGPNLFLLPQRRQPKGPVVYEARLIAEGDERLENNKGETLTLIGDEQSILVLRQEEGPGALVPLLRAAGLRADAVQPHELPTAVGGWRDVSALIIEDVDSLGWSKRLQAITSLLVREGGMGLMMAGSNATFGVGAYQQTAIEPLLPVNLSIRRPKDEPLSALVQLLDKSASMGGDPIRMAREAAIAAAETLSERDLVGVVGFDSAARWVVRLKPKGDGKALRNGVSTLRAGGGTDLYPAFDEALDELEKAEAPLKHIIVLSDGAVEPGAYDKLLARANSGRITVSAVAFGQGADIRFLEDLTTKGKGRLFRSEGTAEGSSLAQIFIRDTVLATGAGIQEKPVEVRPTASGAASPILSKLNFNGSPPLLAHNMASQKGGTAQTLLHTPKGDPILAVGRAGLGHTAAWLSDLGGDWAAGWNRVAGAGAGLTLLETILIRTVRSVVSSESLPLGARGNRLDVRASDSGGLGRLEVQLSTRTPLDGPVRLLAVTRDGDTEETILNPSGPFTASGSVRVNEPGSGLLLAQSAEGGLLARTNFSMPLAPEFTHLGTDRAAMRRWSQVPNGRFEPPVEEVFQPPLQPVPLRTPLAHDLIRGVLLLLLLEVAVRRLPLPKFKRSSSSDTTRRREAIKDRLSRLKTAKASVETVRQPLREVTIERTTAPAKEAPRPTGPPSPPETESTLAKLKKARKKR